MESTLAASLLMQSSKAAYTTLKDNLLNYETSYQDRSTVTSAVAVAATNMTTATASVDTRRDSLFVVIPVTIIYASIFITGTIGNISTCIVIARNKSMHTATNYYLFSLAISDLLLLISGLPAEIYLVWCKYSYIFGEGFCVIRGLAAETSTNASVLTITAFTVERYVAICHPFLSQTMSKLSRAVKLILVIWLVALSFALPQALQVGVVTHQYNSTTIVTCTVKRILIQHSFEISTFLFFIVPMSLITVLYILIGFKLRKSNMMKRKPGNGDTNRSCRHHPGRSTRRVLKMLVAVVVAFFICWAPFHVQRLVAIYGTDSKDHVSSKSKWVASFYLMMTYVSGVLYYVSTTINPILYNIMSNKFRVAFMETLSKSCRVSVLRQEQRSYSSLSRSQQRTAGSRTVPTAGTGMIQDSTECSGNSAREDSPRRSFRSSTAILELPTEQNSHFNSAEKIKRGCSVTRDARITRIDERSSAESKSNEERSRWRESAKYTTLKVTNVEGSEKKWRRFFKWLPGLKHLKFTRRTTYSLSREEDASNVLDNNRQCEFSMTMWNIREGNEQDRVRT